MSDAQYAILEKRVSRLLNRYSMLYLYELACEFHCWTYDDPILSRINRQVAAFFDRRMRGAKWEPLSRRRRIEIAQKLWPSRRIHEAVGATALWIFLWKPDWSE